ncbi:MAG TPA: hypothetical protein VMW16_01810 [Sedimentisphaerales bacterium]|nr:hypothetical protein [Sedimentisphaerales bacterium]
MKGPTQKTLVLAIGVIAYFMMLAGCQEEQKQTQNQLDTPGEKRSRLIAMENMQLKRQIEQQKSLHARQMEDQKKQFEQCLQDKKSLEDLAGKNVQGFMDTIIKDLSDDNQRLQQEVTNLKAQVDSLKAQLQQARAKAP